MNSKCRVIIVLALIVSASVILGAKFLSSSNQVRYIHLIVAGVLFWTVYVSTRMDYVHRYYQNRVPNFVYFPITMVHFVAVLVAGPGAFVIGTGWPDYFLYLTTRIHPDVYSTFYIVVYSAMAVGVVASALLIWAGTKFVVADGQIIHLPVHGCAIKVLLPGDNYRIGLFGFSLPTIQDKTT